MFYLGDEKSSRMPSIVSKNSSKFNASARKKKAPHTKNVEEVKGILIFRERKQPKKNFEHKFMKRIP